VKDGTITQEAYAAAIADPNDPNMLRALDQAAKESGSDYNSPMGFASLVMSPSLWVNMAYQIGRGKPEKISTLPVTRTSRAIQTALKGSPLEPLGNIFGMGAKPEEWVRQKAGLSNYGEWGDYNIDKELSNMVGEGVISVDAQKRAMIERKGEAFDRAVERVRFAEMLSVPLMGGVSQTAKAIKGDVKAGTVPAAMLASIFPAGLFPQGELKLRGLAPQYNIAYERWMNGDDDAINNWLAKHPEYEARLALFSKPEERQQMFLVNDIWDKYFQLDKPNRAKVVEQMGPLFEQSFLDSTTRDYSAVDIQTLAYWSQMLGNKVPETPETKAVTDMPDYLKTPVKVYPEQMAQGIQAYKDEREKLFPMVTVIQSAYYAQPEKSAARRKVLRDFPVLVEYWDWNRQYKEQHPELKVYWDEKTYEAQQEQPPEVPYQTVPQSQTGVLSQEQLLKYVSPMLMQQVVSAANNGGTLTKGAYMQLEDIYNDMGQPGGDLEKFINNMVLPAVIVK
jgi:hypothetical protein